MKKLTRTLLVTLAAFSASAIAEDDGEKTFNVQAYSFTDSDLADDATGSCAEFLQILRDDEKYTLLGTAGVQGPPGVVYTLENNKDEIAIVKCGAAHEPHSKPPGSS